MESISVYDITPLNGGNSRDSLDLYPRDKLDPLVELQQDVCRHVINTEVMMMYGHDVKGYLPPLPSPDRPRSSLASAWGCENQAVRQLGNVTRRGPRSRSLPGSAQVRRSSPYKDQPRPHTTYCSHVRGVLNTRPSEIRPHTAALTLDRSNNKKLQPVLDPEGLILPKRVEDLHDDPVSGGDTSDVASTLPLAGGGLRKPKFGVVTKKKRNTKAQGKTSTGCTARLSDDITRVLRGDLDNLPDHPPTEVKIYLCSNPSDMLEEKAALEKEAYPELREYCQRLGLDFHVVDTHVPGSGVNPEDIRYHDRQLDRCQRQSIGPNFVMLLGDMYGPSCIPLSLSAKDYQFLHKAASVSPTVEPRLLEECYDLENNIVPPAYVLKNPEELSCNRCTELRYVLKESVFTAAQIGKFRTEKQWEFDTSVLELLAREAALNCAPENSALKCLCFKRTLVGIDDDLTNEQIADYTDVSFKDGQVFINEGKRERLDHMATKLKEKLGESNMKHYEVPWQGNGIKPAYYKDHSVYLKQFVHDFTERVKRLIDLNRSVWDVNTANFNTYKEVLQQSKIISNVTQHYIGRVKVSDDIREILHNKERKAYPIVVHGFAGGGRTSALCNLVKTAGTLVNKSSWVAIYHQIGLTPDSLNLQKLLANICVQLSINYNIEPPANCEICSINKISSRFLAMLDVISKRHAEKRPLFILLDDVDKFPATDRADTFFWLPRLCPPNVYTIMTVNNLSEQTIEKLHHRDITNMVGLPDFTHEEAFEFVYTAVKNSGRTISEDQQEFLKTVLENRTDGIEPLLLKFFILDMMRWKYEDSLDSVQLSESFKSALEQHIPDWKTAYGTEFVRLVLTCLCILPWGISETELEDALVSDSAVIKEFREKTRYSDSTLYKMLKSRMNRLLDDLSMSGLTRQVPVHGHLLLSFTHQITQSMICKRYYGASSLDELNSSTNHTAHQTYLHLQELFAQETGVWLQDRDLYRSIGICFITPQLLLKESARKHHLLPHLISKCTTINDEKRDAYLKHTCLCNVQWLQAKLEGTSVKDVLKDFELVLDDLEVNVMRDFLRHCQLGLQKNASSMPLQLIGAISSSEVESHPAITQVLEAATLWIEEQETPLLVPITQCFPSPLDMCKTKLSQICDILCVTAGTNLAVAKSQDGSLEIWDMTNEECAYPLDLKFDKVTPNVFCSVDKVMGINAPLTLNVWEIESGHMVHTLNLVDILGENSTMACLAHTNNFDKVLCQISDDDFNQAVLVLDVTKAKTVLKLDQFDVKDEFFQNSAAFITRNGAMWTIFVNVRGEVADDDKSEDFVKLSAYNIQTKMHKYTVNCGTKKFQNLLLPNEDTVIISWGNCSFDVYKTEDGSHMRHLPYPHADLLVQSSSITNDGYLVALAANSSTFETNSTKGSHGMWVWNLEEESQSELFTETHSPEDGIPKHFIVIEELHLAVLGYPVVGRISVWDLPTASCIHTGKAHMKDLDRIHKTSDPYKIYTCSSDEKEVKLWDLHSVVANAHTDNQSSPRSSLDDSGSGDTRDTKTPDSILKGSDNRMGTETSTRPKSVRFSDNFLELDHNEPSQNETESSETETATPDGDLLVDDSKVDIRSDDETVTTEELCSKMDTPLCFGMMQSHKENMLGVTIVRFSKNSQYLVTASPTSLPLVWDVKTGHPEFQFERHGHDDVGTPWFSFACNDKYILGTTVNNRPTKEGWPEIYKLQVWEAQSGKVLQCQRNMDDLFIAKCVLLDDEERVLVTVLGHFSPGDKTEVQLKVMSIERLEVLHSVTLYLPELPCDMQITNDATYSVLVTPSTDSKTKELTVYNMEGEEFPQPSVYEYRKGNKFQKYGATSNMILRNGICLASGLNGDLQLWDIVSCEYGGNLYHDPATKERSNPGLHNHDGRVINHCVLSRDGRYLVCGGGDGTTSLWDLECEVMIRSYAGHTDEVCQVAISGDNQLVLAAGLDGMLYVWPFAVDRPHCLLYIHAVASDLQLSDDKQTVCVVGNGHNEPSKLMLFRLVNLPKLS